MTILSRRHRHTAYIAAAAIHAVSVFAIGLGVLLLLAGVR